MLDSDQAAAPPTSRPAKSNAGDTGVGWLHDSGLRQGRERRDPAVVERVLIRGIEIHEPGNTSRMPRGEGRIAVTIVPL